MTKKENIIKLLKQYGIVLNKEFCVNTDSTIYKIDENLNVFKEIDNEFIPLINHRTFIYSLLINDHKIVPAIKFNNIEQTILSMLLNNGYKYIARDCNDKIYAYTSKPEKNEVLNMWRVTPGIAYFRLDNNLFKHIIWEDKNPFAIESMIKIDKERQKNKNQF